MKLALIGLGHWGKNIQRILKSIPQVDIVTCDPQAAADYKRIDLIKEHIDACFIVTPADTHYDLTTKALMYGWHCFVEKPLTKSVVEAAKLCELAYCRNKVLFVDHQYLYNPAINEIKTLIMQDKIGKINYMYARTLKLGKVRADVDTLWNFAPHNVSVFNYLLGDMPDSLNCIGWQYNHDISDVAFLTLNYPNNINCHLQVSWLDYQKVRDLMICGTKGAIFYDDVIQSLQFINSNSHRQYIALPRFEPLELSVKAFLNSTQSRIPPVNCGYRGLDVVKILEAAQESMRNSGEVRTI